jgi:hypothetical protein
LLEHAFRGAEMIGVREEPARFPNGRRRGRCVLLVEDDILVREALADELRDQWVITLEEVERIRI